MSRNPTPRRFVRPAVALMGVLVLALPAAVGAAPSDGPATSAPQPADIVTAFNGGVLTITAVDFGEVMKVECAGGNIELNDGADVITGGPHACTSLVELHLVGSPSMDQPQLQNMTAALFPNVTKILLDMKGGADAITLGPLKETVDGGPGSDTLRGDATLGGDAEFTATSFQMPGVPKDKVTSIEHLNLHFENAPALVNVDAREFPGPVGASLTPFSDTYLGSDENDSLSVGTGANTVVGRGGDDSMGSSTGNDDLDGGPGYDEVRSNGAGNLTATDTGMTGVGTDTFSSIEEIEVNQTGATGRTHNFSGFTGFVDWAGGTGSDTITLGPGGSLLTPNDGNDTMNGGAGEDEVELLGISTLTANDTTGNSTEGVDTWSSIDELYVSGTGGVDAFNAMNFSGRGQFLGQAGADVMTGGIGNDVFFLLENDVIVGQGGVNTVRATVEFGANVTFTDSGLSGDLAASWASVQKLLIDVDFGATVDSTGFSGSTFMAADGSSAFLFAGGPGKDIIKGGSGKDQLNGGGGKDNLQGRKGNDKLNGQQGKDTCKGGPGKDKLTSCEKGKA